VVADPLLELGGVWTHLAVADDPDAPETDEQLTLYEQVLASLVEAGIDPGIRHAANSGGVLAHPRSRYDLVRPGIALYGIAPSPDVAGLVELEPALSLTARVSFVKSVSAGDRVSYGLRHTFDHDTTVATVPIGYADGVARRLGLVGGAVLIGGCRRPIVGVVTMDQLMVDCGDRDGDVRVGDEVVLLGRQGDEFIGAGEWADLLGAIPYEIVCGFGPRLPRESEPPVTQGPVVGVGAGAAGVSGAVRSTESSELSP
jgi:alanine racemase